MRYGRPCQRPTFSTSVREGRGGAETCEWTTASSYPPSSRNQISGSTSARSGWRRRRAGRAGRSSRWEARAARALPARRARAAALPPQLALVDLLALPEGGGEVLPAAVRKD